MLTIAMIDMLLVLTGAAIALFSYSLGRNNKNPLPSIPNPFRRVEQPPAPDTNGNKHLETARSSRGGI